MEPRTVDFGNGMDWLVDGWRLFRKNSLMWIVLCLVLLALNVASSMVPFVGGLAMTLLTPALMGGILFSARELDEGRPMEAGHLFSVFRDREKLTPMLVLGAILLVGTLLVVLAAVIFLGGLGAGTALLAGEVNDVPPALLPGILLTVLLVTALNVLVIMGYYFAVPLILFEGIEPVEALKSSFSSSLANFMPFLLFGLLLSAGALAALLPCALGLVVFVPLSFAAWYCSYKDIYPSEREVFGGAVPEHSPGIPPG